MAILSESSTLKISLAARTPSRSQTPSTAAGNASASASLGTSDIWAAALAAFRAASGGGATGPSITSISPASGAVGTSVTISGLNFGSTQGSSTVTFNGTIATPMNWTATTIMVVVPAGASTGNVVVTVGGFASNGVKIGRASCRE